MIKPLHVTRLLRRYWRTWSTIRGLTIMSTQSIPEVVPKEKTVLYRSGRKDECTHNVIVICSFNMRFTWICPGWEDSAHDFRIFKDAMTYPSTNFPHPSQGKYYVVDADYQICGDIWLPVEIVDIICRTTELGVGSNVWDILPHTIIFMRHHWRDRWRGGLPEWRDRRGFVRADRWREDRCWCEDF